MTLYEGAAEDVLPTLAPGSVNAVVTDPPYGDATHRGARTGHPDRSLLTDASTFASITPEEFAVMCGECVRVASGWVVMTCEWQHAAFVERSMPDSFVRCGVWIKPDSAPQFTGDRPGTGWEAVMVLHRPGRKTWNGGGHHAVWTCGVERNNSHPTQKPLKLVRQMIGQFTNATDVILDPFAGSGTTGVAALLEGRRAILVEKDPRYCDVIRKRIRQAAGNAPGTLFQSTDMASLFAGAHG